MRSLATFSLTYVLFHFIAHCAASLHRHDVRRMHNVDALSPKTTTLIRRKADKDPHATPANVTLHSCYIVADPASEQKIESKTLTLEDYAQKVFHAQWVPLYQTEVNNYPDQPGVKELWTWLGANVVGAVAGVKYLYELSIACVICTENAWSNNGNNIGTLLKDETIDMCTQLGWDKTSAQAKAEKQKGGGVEGSSSGGSGGSRGGKGGKGGNGGKGGSKGGRPSH